MGTNSTCYTKRCVQLAGAQIPLCNARILHYLGTCAKPWVDTLLVLRLFSAGFLWTSQLGWLRSEAISEPNRSCRALPCGTGGMQLRKL